MKTFSIIYSILDKKEKKSYLALLILIFCSSFFDLLGLASVLPFLFLITNEEFLETSKYINFLYVLFLNFNIIYDKRGFFLIFGFLTLLLFLISILSRIFTYQHVVKFSLNFENSLSIRLVTGYLSKNYDWYLDKNISKIHKNILLQTREVIDKTVYPLVNLYSHIMIILFILFFLLFINIGIVINIFLSLFLFLFIYFFFIKKKIKAKGNDSYNSNANRIKILTNIFSSIKHTKIYHLEEKYLEFFSKYSGIFTKNQIFIQIASILPRQFLELLGFGFIILLVLVNIYYDEILLKDFVPTIIIYTMAGYRLIPAVQQVYHSLTNITFSNSSFEALLEDLKTFTNEIKPKNKNLSKMPFSKSLKLQKVSYKYKTSNTNILNDISLNIKAFSKIGIIGQSGSGKSTLMDIIIGLIKPTNGKVFVDENFLDNDNIFSWQKNIGYVTQDINFFNDSLINNIVGYQLKKNINQKFVEKISKICCIHDFITKQLPSGYNTNLGENGITLSGGQKQRIAILRALYLEPKLLILDEATNSLDKQTEELIIKSICNFSKKKMSLIIVSHSMNALKYCDKIYSLENKKLKTIK
jgi:ABC-type bacteriocin/lantibiotic exporter with double-glycine peptidase domain